MTDVVEKNKSAEKTTNRLSVMYSMGGYYISQAPLNTCVLKLPARKTDTNDKLMEAVCCLLEKVQDG
jgi:hypothetical protein